MNDTVQGDVTYAQFLNADLGRWLDERLNADQADVIHDLLASLAEQMIEMNRQRQVEVKGFLAWLERTVDAKVDDLSNRTKLRDYHGHDLNALLDVLRQNRRRLKVNPDARDLQENVEREFNQSTEKLAPLKERIAATDRLIDLIVYRLYGLTEEEVATVEGRARQKQKLTS